MPPKYGYVDRDGPRDSNGVDMSVRCSHCNNKHRFKVSISDYNKWAEGHDDIKSLGHYMNDNAKEIASDGMCKDCKSKNMEKSVEELIKSCPRCGKSSANKSNPSGRCRACLNKLAANKKKPGHWQRAQTKADDALRRQKGDNGTAHKKSTGLGNRDSIVKQVKRAEKKTGQKLSPDRKNNGKGYAASNTRMVPEHLNRGRHKVDNKKLRNWRKKLKKHSISSDEMYTCALAKAEQLGDERLVTLLRGMTPVELSNFIEKEDV